MRFYRSDNRLPGQFRRAPGIHNQVGGAEMSLARIEAVTDPRFRQDVTRDRLLGFDFLAQMADAHP